MIVYGRCHTTGLILRNERSECLEGGVVAHRSRRENVTTRASFETALSFDKLRTGLLRMRASGVAGGAP